MSDYRGSEREKRTKAAWYRRRAQDATWIEKRRQGARAYRRGVTRSKLYVDEFSLVPPEERNTDE